MQPKQKTLRAADVGDALWVLGPETGLILSPMNEQPLRLHLSSFSC